MQLFVFFVRSLSLCENFPYLMIPILDTHQHLIVTELMPYSWTNAHAPLKNRAFGTADYLRASAGAGIARTIFMEASPDNWRAEAPFVYKLAAREDSIIEGVIAGCRPEDDGFEAYLNEIAHPKLVGLRRICHVEPDELSGQPRFVENVRRLGNLNLTFDLCFAARQLPLAADLARACPDVTFVLDHCGNPVIAESEWDGWRKYIGQLARLPNVNCKISGVLAYCKPGEANTQTVRPYVEACIEAFGWNRVVWGSDWPVCNLRATLAQWVETSRTIVAGASQDEQRGLFAGNAERIYLKRTI